MGCEGSPILLLTTARHELFETRAEWAAEHEAEQVVLEPLSTADSEAIVAELLGGLELPVRERITSAAEGNPLYVEQITAMLVESGAIRRDGDQWVATGRSGDIAIPPTVEALVGARLDALRQEDRQVIDPASVIGLGFAVEAVVNLVPEDAAPAVLSRLASLTTKQFVRPTVADEEYYRFGHAVIKDAAYRSLLKRTRAELHEHFVDWAEPINRERGREIEFEEILGYHLEQAYRYRTELGSADHDTHDVGRRASDKLASAGRRALGRGDMPAAANLLARAALLLPTEDPIRIGLLPELAEALMEVGDLEQAGTVIAEAGDLAGRVGAPGLAARADLGRLGLDLYATGFAGGTEKAMDVTRAAIGVLKSSGDDAGLARAWRMAAIINAIGGRYEDSAEAAQRIIDHAVAANDQRLVSRAAGGLASDLLHGPRPVAELVDICEGLLVQTEGDRKAEAIISGVIGQLRAMTGAFEEARRLYRHGQALLADLGQSVTAAATSTESSRIEFLAGDLVAAEHELRRDDQALAQIGEQYFRSTITGLLANVLLAQGRFEQAGEYATICQALASDDDVWSQVLWRTARARLDGDRESANEMIDLATEAIALADATVDIELAADARVALADLLLRTGRPARAEPPLREALDRYEQKGDLVLSARTRERLASLV